MEENELPDILKELVHLLETFSKPTVKQGIRVGTYLITGTVSNPHFPITYSREITRHDLNLYLGEDERVVTYLYRAIEKMIMDDVYYQIFGEEKVDELRQIKGLEATWK